MKLTLPSNLKKRLLCVCLMAFLVILPGKFLFDWIALLRPYSSISFPEYALYRVSEMFFLLPHGSARLSVFEPKGTELSLKDTLTYASRAHIYLTSVKPDNQYTFFLRLGNISSKDHPEIFALFHYISDFHGTRRSSDADVRIEFLFFTSRKTKQVFDYISTTGEIGRDGEWYIVPAKLRDYIRNEITIYQVNTHRMLNSVPAPKLVKREDGRRYLIIRDSLNPSEPGLPKYVDYCEVTRWNPVESGQTQFKFTDYVETPSFPFPDNGVDTTYYLQFRWHYADGYYGPSSKVYTFTLPDR